MALVHLMDAQDMGELAVMHSLLDGNGIAYVVQHEHVGSLYPGIPSMTCRVLVDEADRARAGTLVSRLRLQLRDAS